MDGQVTFAAFAAPFGRSVARGVAQIRAGLKQARSAGANLVVFPECALGGPPGGEGAGPETIDLGHAAIDELIEAAGETVLCFGISERCSRGLYSTTVCLSGAGIHGTHRKVHIPPSELRTYCAGESFGAFETPVGRIGMLSCYDKIFPEAARALALDGAGTIVSTAAWPVCRLNPAAEVGDDTQSLHFDLMDQARAVENQVVWVSSNLSGNWHGLRYVGQSKVVDPDGHVLAQTEPGKPGMAVASVGAAEMVETTRRAIYHLRDRRPSAYGKLPSYGYATA